MLERAELGPRIKSGDDNQMKGERRANGRNGWNGRTAQTGERREAV